jgi:hypothetical protein
MGFTSVRELELPKEIDIVLVADQTKGPFTSRFRFRKSPSLIQRAGTNDQ